MAKKSINKYASESDNFKLFWNTDQIDFSLHTRFENGMMDGDLVIKIDNIDELIQFLQDFKKEAKEDLYD